MYRRTIVELGIDSCVGEVFTFVYQSVYSNELFEFKQDHVFIAPSRWSGRFISTVKKHPKYNGVSILGVKEKLCRQPPLYTSWSIIAFPKAVELYSEKVRIKVPARFGLVLAR